MSSHRSKLASLSDARTVIAAGNPLAAVAMAPARKAALRAAWLKHTIKRATAAVRSASDDDYRAFGWNRSDVLTQLQGLRHRAEQSHAAHPYAFNITLAKGN
jgi:hypothetical protein